MKRKWADQVQKRILKSEALISFRERKIGRIVLQAEV